MGWFSSSMVHGVGHGVVHDCSRGVVHSCG